MTHSLRVYDDASIENPTAWAKNAFFRDYNPVQKILLVLLFWLHSQRSCSHFLQQALTCSDIWKNREKETAEEGAQERMRGQSLRHSVAATAAEIS